MIKLNKKGVISISVIYSFFLVFCLLLVLILATYTNNRLNFKMLKNDIKEKYGGSVVISTSTIESEIDTTSMMDTTDDMGSSYYYSGNVNNNYIVFGKYTSDMYFNENDYTLYNECPDDGSCTKIASEGDYMLWRIIRKNGDGSIRLIYDGTIRENYDDPFNLINGGTMDNVSYNIDVNDAIYTGYMYIEGGQHGISTDSTIKTFLDNWYEFNLSGSKYEKYIVNSIFCVNRNAYADEAKNTGAPGFGTTTQYFENYNKDIVTDLKCSNDYDRFSTSVSYNSNGILDYPIGLLSYEEAILIGLNTSNDSINNYLTNGFDFWTLTPSHYNNEAYNFYVNKNGKIEKNKVSEPLAIRPVISISANTPVIGEGKIDKDSDTYNPFAFSLGGREFMYYYLDWGNFYEDE